MYMYQNKITHCACTCTCTVYIYVHVPSLPLSLPSQVNPVRRITIQGIRDHAWFTVGLPDYLFPLGDTADSQMDSLALSEVCQKLGVPPHEVVVAVRGGESWVQGLVPVFALAIDLLSTLIMRIEICMCTCALYTCALYVGVESNVRQYIHSRRCLRNKQ